MTLNFVQFIQDNTSFTPQQELDFLNDFTIATGYEDFDVEGNPNPISKAEWANQKIEEFIRGTVNFQRQKVAQEAAAWDNFNLE